MTELYLRLLDRFITPVLLLFGVFLFSRGHNSPGGGFIAGLVVAAALQLQIMSRGDDAVRRQIGVYLQPMLGVGLLIAAAAGVIGLFGDGFFEGTWWSVHIGRLTLEIGSPVLFDVGVFIVVVGVVTSYLLGLSQTQEG